MSSKTETNNVKLLITTDNLDIKEGHVGPKPNDVPTMRQIPQVKPKENSPSKDKSPSNDKK